MNKYILCLVVGLILGFLAAFLFQMISGASEGTNAIGDLQLRETALSLEQSSKNFERLGENLSQAVNRLSFLAENRTPETDKTIAVSEDKQAQKKRIEPVSTKEGEIEKISVVGWPSVIDKDLSRVMVEEGITPFDTGVSTVLKEALKKLKEAEGVLEKHKEDLRGRYPGLLIASADLCYGHIRSLEAFVKLGNGENYKLELTQYKEIKVELDNIEKQHAGDRKTILEAFRSSLLALKSKDKDKK